MTTIDDEASAASQVTTSDNSATAVSQPSQVALVHEENGVGVKDLACMFGGRIFGGRQFRRHNLSDIGLSFHVVVIRVVNDNDNFTFVIVIDEHRLSFPFFFETSKYKYMNGFYRNHLIFVA